MPWQLTDYPVLRLSLPLTGANQPILPFPVVPTGQLWRVDQVTVAVTNPNVNQQTGAIAPPEVMLYDQPVPATVAAFPATLIPAQGTTLSLWPAMGYMADFDDQSSPLTILGGGQLSIVFFGVYSGQTILARVQYGLYQGSPGAPQPVAGAVRAPSIPVGI